MKSATKFQANIEELKGYVDRLQMLLDEPEPGLASWHGSYLAAANRILNFFSGRPVEPDLLGVDVPLPSDPKEMPKPICTKCGQEVPHFYFYVYKLESTQGTMVFQATCCPHAGCRALFIVLPIGLEAGKLATPGKAGWPGMPS